MLPAEYQWIIGEFEPEGNAWQLLQIARELEQDGNLEGAATVYDRAYGLEPATEDIRAGRQRVLDRLAVVEHGLLFRYIPAGVFLMGCDAGEPDERPWHPVWLSAYWLSETPVSWAAFCRLLDWEAPPAGHPREGTPEGSDRDRVIEVFHLNKIRLQYCEDHTTQAGDWHRHDPRGRWLGAGQPQTSQELFGSPPRDNPEAEWRYDTKPMVAVAWEEAVELAERISSRAVRYALPTEAQWEKAARGGLIGARHAWGNEPPSPERCDCDRFPEFSILPMRTLPPNGYGLYAMNGGVWEWARDWYDRDYYAHAPDTDPEGPPTGEEKVLRGGSWADCAEVQTVAFRMSRTSRGDRRSWAGYVTPTIGFRLCRTAATPPQLPGAPEPFGSGSF